MVARLDADRLTYAVNLSGHDGVRGFADIRTGLMFRRNPAPDLDRSGSPSGASYRQPRSSPPALTLI